MLKIYPQTTFYLLIKCYNCFRSDHRIPAVGDEESRSYGEEGSRLFPLTGVAPSTISTGILDVNNILIHVGQNLVNFLAGSAVWMVLGSLNLGTARSARAEEGGFLSWFSGQDLSWILRTVADTADIFQRYRQEL